MHKLIRANELWPRQVNLRPSSFERDSKEYLLSGIYSGSPDFKEIQRICSKFEILVGLVSTSIYLRMHPFLTKLYISL